jgi:hypothetical protein
MIVVVIAGAGAGAGAGVGIEADWYEEIGTKQGSAVQQQQ